jgi:catechol 2,3-dioxygenase
VQYSFRPEVITTTLPSIPGKAWVAPHLRPARPGFTTAIVYPTRPSLADALHRVLQAHIPLEGASDHGVSQSIYLRDPDDNGVELYWDKPKDQWPRTADGKLAMFTRALDLTALLKESSIGVALGSGPRDL